MLASVKKCTDYVPEFTNAIACARESTCLDADNRIK